MIYALLSISAVAAVLGWLAFRYRGRIASFERRAEFAESALADIYKDNRDDAEIDLLGPADLRERIRQRVRRNRGQ